jgi:hypothetical protein
VAVCWPLTSRTWKRAVLAASAVAGASSEPVTRRAAAERSGGAGACDHIEALVICRKADVEPDGFLL